jgi:IclR family transcriptional regulator, pca regulon regulatory protein
LVPGQYIAQLRDDRTSSNIQFKGEHTMSDAEIHKRDFAQTLARGLACLEVLAGAIEPMSCSQVAAAMDVSRAAARRVLLTLQYLGYTREERGVYVASSKVLSLGRGMLGNGGVWSAAAVEVVALANRFNEPCSISVLEGLEILFVCRDSTRRVYSLRLGVGDRLPAYCSASGKMLLALLPDKDLATRLSGARLKPRGPASLTDVRALKAALRQAREAGFALAVDEMEDGTISIAVPIREREGKPIAAFSVASQRSRQSASDLKKSILPELRGAAKRVEDIVRDFQDRKWTVF